MTTRWGDHRPKGLRLTRSTTTCLVRIVVAASALSAVFLGSVSAPAQAAPSISQVRQQVQDLQAKAESATERFNEAQTKLAGIQSELASLNAQRTRQKAQLAVINDRVSAIARQAYATGGIDTSLQVLLADDPSSFLAQASALDQVSKAQAANLRRTQTARLRLSQTETAMQQREDIARGIRDQMAKDKQEANAALADAEKVLSSLVGAARRRYERQQAAARAAAAKHAKQSLHRFSTTASRTASPRAMKAVRYALQQVGDRYVAAAAGPSAFDCSGLTMSAWRQAGISLPHLSYTQFSKTQHIPLSQARPGDLIFFFGGSVHHVAMYIGGGRMVHAANPSSGVIITNVMDPWYRAHFSGVGRVL